MLLNYLSNAVKFTEKGSITLRKKIIEETDHDLLLRFEVEDTGMGISEEDKSRLFTAFEQADNSITRRHGGTGLGLAIELSSFFVPRVERGFILNDSIKETRNGISRKAIQARTDHSPAT